ncbi:MAG: UDP-N-acetylenolpyruvoylglucosamine reductase [Parcubacteria group bacterium]|nr:UDP-N-acetylenolpyruvoylglucosamine reductase [Parcubacteria group bacterium]
MPRENVPLASLTTLRVGGPARFVHTGDSMESIKAAAAHSRSCGLSLYPLGQGSNVLAGDAPIDVVILKMETNELTFKPDSDFVEVIADAGVSWERLVQECTEQGLWGVENLAGIPGTAGAAPVQNIGAYGAELADTFAWLECYDTATDMLMRLDAEGCAFGYRESRFKHEPNLIITRIALRLARTSTPKTSYADLQKLMDAGELLNTPQKIADAVRRVRRVKFPDLTQEGTAGSFFKNPTITANAYEELQAKYPALQGFAAPSGIKIPLAWILDHVLGLRGYREGRAHLFQNQPLVLVTENNATAQDVEMLANNVSEKVFAATNILIEREVRSLK